MKLRTLDRRALLGVVCTLVGLGIGGTLAGTSHRNEAVRSDSVGRFLQLAFVSDALAESTNPHGDLEIDCSVCHTATSWRVDTKIEGFDHAETAHYPLTLAHSTVPCRSCHTDLVFENAGTNCADCHDDVHNGDRSLLSLPHRGHLERHGRRHLGAREHGLSALGNPRQHTLHVLSPERARGHVPRRPGRLQRMPHG